MKKIYTFSAAALLSFSVMAQDAQQLVSPVQLNQANQAIKLNYPLKKEVKTNKFKRQTEVFLQQNFQAAMPFGNFSRGAALGSVGWERDSSRAGDVLFIPELNDTANGEPKNFFAVSNDSKNENLNGSNVATGDVLLTDTLDFTAIKETVILQFDYFANDLAATATSTMSVDISIDAGLTFQPLFTPTLGTEWQEAYIDLAAFADETEVIIRFSHNDGGGTQSAFAVDNLDIRTLETDLILTVDADHSYTAITETQNRPINFTVTVSNNGLKDEATVTLTGSVTDPFGVVTDYSVAAFALDAESDTIFSFGPFSQVDTGDYSIDFTVDAGVGANEETLSDNSFSFISNLNDTLISRDNGENNVPLPIGNNIDLGVGIPGNLIAVSRYSFVAADTITGFTFIMDATAMPNTPYGVNIYASAGDGTPNLNNAIATSATIRKTAAMGTAETVTTTLGTGGLYTVGAGDTIYVGVRRPIGSNGLANIGGDSTGTNLGTSFIYFNIAQLGISLPLGITEAPIIRIETKEIDNSNATAELRLGEASFSNEYFSTPINMLTDDSLYISVFNDGLKDTTNVTVNLNYTTPSGNPTNTMQTIDEVKSGDSQTVAFSLDKSEIGTYSLFAGILRSNGQLVLSSDTIDFEVTDTTLSRFEFDTGFLGALNWGVRNLQGGIDTTFVGTTISTPVTDTLTAITIIPNPTFVNGDVLFGLIRDAATDAVLARTVQVTTPMATPGQATIFRLRLQNPLILSADKDYYVEVSTIPAAGGMPRSALYSDKPFFATPNTDYVRSANTGTRTILSNVPAIGDGSVAISAEFGRQSTVGINESTGLEVNLYPNPAKTELNVANAANSTYRLINIAGKVVSEGAINSDLESINVSILTPGLYVLQLSGTVNESTRVIID